MPVRAPTLYLDTSVLGGLRASTHHRNRHVAACTVAKIDYLVSWNFKPLVNIEREKGFNAVNLLHGYQSIRIVNPLELIYGKDDEDL